MANAKNLPTADKIERKIAQNNGVSSAVYGLGFIGALMYFIQHASSFVDGLFGILKAIVWPGILVYKALELLKL